MAFDLSIIPAGAISELDLAHQSRFLQIPERVVDSGVTNCRQALSSLDKDLARGQVIITLAYHLKHCVSLWRQIAATLFCAIFLHS
jgi:hypothetical protein